MRIAFLHIATLLLVLTGCVLPTPAGNKNRLASANPGKATVYVLGDFGGLAVINGTRIGALQGKSYTWFHAEAGIANISINDPSIPSRKMSARSFVLIAGKTYYFRYKVMSFKGDGALVADIISGRSRNALEFDPGDIQELSEAEAMPLIQKYKLVGSAL
jgi:hypothetical protein